MSQRRPQDPVYIPLYPRDFLSSNSVDAMTTEEVGAYLLLMMRSWSETPPATLPTDDAILARMARMTPARWAKAKSKVLKPWHIRDGRWVQPRLEKEHAAATEYVKAASVKAAKAAGARWGRNAQAMHEHDKNDAQALPEHCTSNAKEGRARQLESSSSTACASAVDSICDAIESGFVDPAGNPLAGAGEMYQARERLTRLLADPWRDGTCADFAVELADLLKAQRFGSVNHAVKYAESVCRRCRRDGCLPGDPMKGGKRLAIERETEPEVSETWRNA